MRAVLDTNVAVRALLRRRGPAGPLLARLSDGAYTPIYSRPMLDELIDVLGRPRIRQRYHLGDAEVAITLALIRERGKPVLPSRRVTVCRDPNDDKLLEAAVAGRADAIVSGDNDLLAPGSFEGIPIVSPAAFLTMLARSTDPKQE